jgi:hypothetical protein
MAIVNEGIYLTGGVFTIYFCFELKRFARLWCLRMTRKAGAHDTQ